MTTPNDGHGAEASLALLCTLLGQVPLVAADRSLSGKPQDVGVLLVFRYIW